MEQKELMIKMALDNWNSTIARTDKHFDSLTDEQLMHEIAPGRNRGIYLLGHLAAVHDRMLPLLGFGDQRRPQMNDTFLTQPDKAVQDIPAASDLRAYWKEANGALSDHFKTLQPDDWFAKHTAVSAEDFAKEPHRNRLNVLLGRTNHLANHLGQLLLLK